MLVTVRSVPGVRRLHDAAAGRRHERPGRRSRWRPTTPLDVLVALPGRAEAALLLAAQALGLVAGRVQIGVMAP